jgi:predicted dehydrogenase
VAPRSVIVGTGFIGEVHARAVRRAGGTTVGVVSRSAEGASHAAAAWGVETSGTDLAAVLEEVEADLVHVCTPNAVHAEQVRAALAAGAHVICEKPLTTSLNSALALQGEADAAAAVHAVPFAYRYYPTVREMRARVRSGAAGRISLLHGQYLQDWLITAPETMWRGDPAAGGPSRAFADIGIHWCDLAEFVTGDRIVDLVATASTLPQADGSVMPGEDLVALVLRTAGGAVGTLKISQISRGRSNRLELYVDAANESLGFEQQFPDQLWLGDVGRAGYLERGAAFDAPDARRLSRVPPGHPQGYQDCFDAFVADVYAAIEGSAPDGLPTFADGVRAARLTEAVLRSAEQSAWVTVA